MEQTNETTATLSVAESKEEQTKRKRRQTIKDFFFIFFGIFLYAFGFTAFILPE